ncbi:hypothetical protein QEN19_004330 [Hanseniaspora menglaensis]
MDNSQRLDSSTLSKLTPQELKLYKLYGKLPNKKDLLNYKLKDNRKFFDSGDYHMTKDKEKQSPKVQNAVPIHKPEQIKVNRRMSSTIDPSIQEQVGKSHFVTENKNDFTTPESIVSSDLNSSPFSNESAPRTRSNSLMNSQMNTMPTSPLAKQP